MGRKILEIEAVTKKYKEFTLEPVSFSLEAGSSMGVMGAYGSGKTTLLKILTGQIRPEAGTVKFFGKETGKDKSEMLEYCGIVPAEGGFPDCLNAKEINKILKGCYKNWQEACFFELADRFSLSLTRPLKELTRGAGQKVRILAALCHEPKLLLLDEPLKGLEQEDRELAENLFREFGKQEDQGVLSFTEQPEEAEKNCDNLAFLYKGRLIFAESQETLRKRYGFLEASDEKLELVPRSAWCGIRRTENGGCLLLERAALPKELAAELPVEVPALTTIMEYLTKETVKR